jgi:hypothetical protein
MPFITVNADGYSIDDSDLDEKPLIQGFLTLEEKHGFDSAEICCGMNSGPDFGYFELAERFWNASLCIYFAGVTNRFMGNGIGYSETWLFNARHSIELFLKGFLLHAAWFNELQENPQSSGEKSQFSHLKKLFNSPHNLHGLYEEYKKRIKAVIDNWKIESTMPAPLLRDVVLSPESEVILTELDDADKSSFRFRYPSLKQGEIDYLQKIEWNHDENKLFTNTGIPKEAGYFFDHIQVINSLHAIVKEMKSLRDCYIGYSEYHQEFLYEYLDDYFYQFNNEGDY